MRTSIYMLDDRWVLRAPSRDARDDDYRRFRSLTVIIDASAGGPERADAMLVLIRA